MTAAQVEIHSQYLQSEAEQAKAKILADLADVLVECKTPADEKAAQRAAERKLSRVTRGLQIGLAKLSEELLDAPGRPGRKQKREYPWHTHRQERSRYEQERPLSSVVEARSTGAIWGKTARGGRKQLAS